MCCALQEQEEEQSVGKRGCALALARVKQQACAGYNAKPRNAVYTGQQRRSVTCRSKQNNWGRKISRSGR